MHTPHDEPRSTATTSDDAVTVSRAANRRDILVIIALAAVSFALGFAIVHAFMPRSAPPAPPAPSPSAPVAAAEKHERATDHGADADSEDREPSAPAPTVPEVPPGPTPEGVRLDGAAAYLKCWSGDANPPDKECDRLRLFERRVASRLYVVAECRDRLAADALGILSLGAAVDFSKNTVSWWSGPSSTIAQAKRIGGCVRRKLAGVPLDNIAHRHDRYRVFFTVEFFDPVVRAKELARKRKRGRTVSVTKDRVNVREAPVDGPPVGRLNSGATVTLLRKNGQGWCHVLTADGTEGWMICDALDL